MLLRIFTMLVCFNGVWQADEVVGLIAPDVVRLQTIRFSFVLLGAIAFGGLFVDLLDNLSALRPTVILSAIKYRWRRLVIAVRFRNYDDTPDRLMREESALAGAEAEEALDKWLTEGWIDTGESHLFAQKRSEARYWSELSIPQLVGMIAKLRRTLAEVAISLGGVENQNVWIPIKKEQNRAILQLLKSTESRESLIEDYSDVSYDTSWEQTHEDAP